jgi:hypothetical protein
MLSIDSKKCETIVERREFILSSAGAAAFSAVNPLYGFSASDVKHSNKLLNAYYFRAHMYTMVPAQVREDLKWMRDLGTDVVSIAVLEQDLWAAIENVDIIVDEAEKIGMKVFIVPSRWGGMVAGAPKVPSLFSVKNPDTWMENKNGRPVSSSVSGVISSVHSQKTLDFFIESAKRSIKLWGIKGIIWDEPKTFDRIDCSKNAWQQYGQIPSREESLQANTDFYSAINSEIKKVDRNIVTNLFLQADAEEDVIHAGALIKDLDYYGCDGRPWSFSDGGKLEASGKVLLGNGERFIEAAHQNKKKALWLMENHNMLDEDAKLMNKRLPKILKKDVQQYIYYYYPRNLESPDTIMEVMRKHLIEFNQ